MNDVVVAIRSALRAHMNEMADKIATGEATSYEQYQRFVGIIDGLALSERVVIDADKASQRLLDEDDD